MQLWLGDEPFDVEELPVDVAPTSFLFARSMPGVDPLALQGALRTKFQFKPAAGLASRAHKRLTRAITQKHSHDVKVKLMASEQKDPGLQAREAAKVAARRDRDQERLEVARRKRLSQGGGSSRPAVSMRRRLMSEMEETEAEQRILKAQQMPLGAGIGEPASSSSSSKPISDSQRRRIAAEELLADADDD